MKLFIAVLTIMVALLISAQTFAGKEIVLKEGGSDVYNAKIGEQTSVVFIAYEYSLDLLSGCAGYHMTDKFGVQKFSIGKGVSTRVIGADISCKSQPGKGIYLLIKPDLN